MATPCNVLITGGTDGIGLRLARRYQDTGARVAVTGRRAPEEVARLSGISYIRADQNTPDHAALAVLEGLAGLGWQHCDIAILNAGCGQMCDPLEESAKNLCQTLAVNLTATILIAHALAPMLGSANHGRLVLIGSTSHKGAKRFASYAATKAGLHGFARSLHEEWRGRINVQIIHPGPTGTDMHAKAGFDPGWIRRFFLNPDDAARMIVDRIGNNRSPVSVGFMASLFDILTLRRWRL
jgi:NAD(P)-dependent dehydrogenase (short-subunit alcohol dehydrogenase family)